MRPVLATTVAAMVAALTALILGEYEFGTLVAVVAGVGVGLVIGEVFDSLGRWRGPLPATIAALLAGGSLAWGAWIDSGQGLEPYPPMAWLAVALGVVTGAARVAPRRRKHPASTDARAPG